MLQPSIFLAVNGCPIQLGSDPLLHQIGVRPLLGFADVPRSAKLTP